VLLHRLGRNHDNADALSRIPHGDGHCRGSYVGNRLGDFTCGGCKYCKKVHENRWSFFDDVDDAVPLTSKSHQFTGGLGKPVMEGTNVYGKQDETILVTENDKPVYAVGTMRMNLDSSEVYFSSLVVNMSKEVKQHIP
jgi:hypothetical protein